MKDIEGVLKSIAETFQLSYTVFQIEGTTQEPILYYPILVDKQSSMFRTLFDACQKEKKTHIIIDITRASAACVYVRETNQMILLYLVYLGSKSKDAILTGLKKCKYSLEEIENALKNTEETPVYSLSEFKEIVQFLYHYANGSEIPMDMDNLVIYKENKVLMTTLSAKTSTRVGSFISDVVYDNRQVHDSYSYEVQLMRCIREGNKAKLIQLRKYAKPVDSGILVSGRDTLRQLKNQFICACTLATRAAIDGGLQPEVAYAVSDYYIQRAESRLEESAIHSLFNEMFIDFIERVHSMCVIQAYSDITKRCVDYINEHIREDISYQSLADLIGITKNYMLSKFKEDTKFSMVEYIKLQKVEEAKHLLLNTDLTLVEISEALSFSSQSFFTSVFRSCTKQTPKQYRDETRRMEFERS